MRITAIVATALLVIALRGFAPATNAQSKPVPIDCNRSCLEGLMEQYLAALVAHNPIKNNLIRRVEMIGTGVPYHFNSAWGAGLSGK